MSPRDLPDPGANGENDATVSSPEGRPGLLRRLADERYGVRWLLGAAALLVLIRLGAGELWTHEGRWAVICQEMLRSGDFLRPFLLNERYDDKPLLSYWMMVGFARVLGGLNEWALRLPGALSGILAVWCTYRLGRRLYGPATGLAAGWILLTCFEFVFWSRVATTDMLNLAGSIAAVTWFIAGRDRPDVRFHAVFFVIIAVTCLTKGLIGAVIPGIALMPLLLKDGAWRRHLRPAALIGMLPAIAVYFAPFLAVRLGGAAEVGVDTPGGLEMVFRENIVRFFRPFDHRGHFYTYLLYLPLYFAPWSIFLPGVIVRGIRQRRELSPDSRWALWAILLIFVFLTVSGSKRSYYILPILPFVALATADFLLAGARSTLDSRRDGLFRIALITSAVIFVWFGILAPWRETFGGLRPLAVEVRAAVEPRAPIADWQVLSYDGVPKAAYYLSPDRRVDEVHLESDDDRERLRARLREHPLTILITRRKAVHEVIDLFDDTLILEASPRLPPFMITDRVREKDKETVVIIPLTPRP